MATPDGYAGYNWCWWLCMAVMMYAALYVALYAEGENRRPSVSVEASAV